MPERSKSYKEIPKKKISFIIQKEKQISYDNQAWSPTWKVSLKNSITWNEINKIIESPIKEE